MCSASHPPLQLIDTTCLLLDKHTAQAVAELDVRLRAMIVLLTFARPVTAVAAPAATTAAAAAAAAVDGRMCRGSP
eukprot:2338-Heterococcus_DN1.PRE.3